MVSFCRQIRAMVTIIAISGACARAWPCQKTLAPAASQANRYLNSYPSDLKDKQGAAQYEGILPAIFSGTKSWKSIRVKLNSFVRRFPNYACLPRLGSIYRR